MKYCNDCMKELTSNAYHFDGDDRPLFCGHCARQRAWLLAKNEWCKVKKVTVAGFEAAMNE